MKKKNLLDMIPYKNEKYRYTTDEFGIVSLFVEYNSWADKLVRKFKKTPKECKIDFDEMSSYIWGIIDGERTVDDIAHMFSDKFGEKAEPLYNRIAYFFRTLKQNDFILYKGNKGDREK